MNDPKQNQKGEANIIESKNQLNYTINLDCEDVDGAIKKVSQLIELLKEANSLISSLNKTIDIKH